MGIIFLTARLIKILKYNYLCFKKIVRYMKVSLKNKI